MERYDRRKSFRVPIDDGWAECWSARDGGRCRIHNLSQGGALLTDGPSFPKEAFLRVSLQLPQKPILALDAIVRRIDASGVLPGMGTAIEFGWLSDEEQDVIADVIADCFSKDIDPRVLICTSRKGEGRALERALESIGFTPVRAATPLCTVGHLVAARERIKAVVIGTSLRGTTARDIAAFLAEHRPDLHLILLGKPNWSTRLAASPISHTIVRKPWTLASLERALQDLETKKSKPEIR